jgi:hypothetical protein
MILVNRATYAGEYIARVGANQSDRADRDCQNDGKHYRILCDILAFFPPPGIAKKVSQLSLHRSCH